MDSIAQNNKKEKENTKRYLPHDLKTRENAVKTYLNNGDKIHVQEISYI